MDVDGGAGPEMRVEAAVVTQPPALAGGDDEVFGTRSPLCLEQLDRCLVVDWMVPEVATVLVSGEVPPLALAEPQQLGIATTDDQHPRPCRNASRHLLADAGDLVLVAEPRRLDLDATVGQLRGQPHQLPLQVGAAARLGTQQRLQLGLVPVAALYARQQPRDRDPHWIAAWVLDLEQAVG